MNRVREISGKDWGGLSDQFVASFEPVVIRALVEHWPVVKSFGESGEQGLNYVRRFANDRPVTVYVGEPEISGRFGYSDELTQLNFKSGRIPLEKVLDRLISQQDDTDPPAVYVGSSPVGLWLPDFSRENHIQKRNPETVESFWLGSKTVIAPHLTSRTISYAWWAGGEKLRYFLPINWPTSMLARSILLQRGNQSVRLILVSQTWGSTRSLGWRKR